MAVALATAIALCALTFAADMALPLGIAGAMPYLLPVLMTLWTPGVSATLAFAVVAILLTILGYVLSPPGAEPWQVLTNRAMVVGAIAAFAGVVVLRKRAESARREIDRNFSEIVDTIPGMVWIMAPGYRLVYLNAYLRALTGLGADEDVTTRWMELIHPDDMPELMATTVDHF